MKIFRKSLLTSTAFILSISLFSCSKNNSSDSSELENVKISPQSITFEWQDVYMNKLSEFKSSADFSADVNSGSRFDLFDITGDEIPELIISPNNNGQTACRIYSCINSELVELGETGNSGIFCYLPDMQLIKDEYQGDGFIISYSDNSMSAMSASSGVNIRYEIDGKEVLLPEYDSALSEYNASPAIDAGRKYTFGDNALNYAVKCSESWGAVLLPSQRDIYTAKLSEYLNSLSSIYAFELCDLNSDEIPELIISNGTALENYCEIYYLTEDGLQKIEGSFGAYGKFTFDTEQFVLSAGSAHWSINNSNFSVDDYKQSDNLAEIGRKYLLNEKNITIALN